MLVKEKGRRRCLCGNDCNNTYVVSYNEFPQHSNVKCVCFFKRKRRNVTFGVVVMRFCTNLFSIKQNKSWKKKACLKKFKKGNYFV